MAEGTGEDEDADKELRTYAARSYIELLEGPNVPDVLVQVCWHVYICVYAWICMCTYAELLEGPNVPDVLVQVCSHVYVSVFMRGCGCVHIQNGWKGPNVPDVFV